MLEDRPTGNSFLQLASLFRKMVGLSPHRPDTAVRPSPGAVTPVVRTADLTVSQFAHDLRNQLTLVIGCAEDIARRLPRGEGQARLAELIRAADRAAALTKDLLRASDPRTLGQPTIDANSVIASNAGTFAALAGERVTLQLALSTDPLVVAAERSDLERILLNLALNAHDAMPGGGVMRIETSLVLASGAGHRGGAHPHAKLTVTDSGVGMTPEIKSRIFEPMFTTKARGTGLGLTTVAFTVRQLHGVMSVESDLGKGTSMTVLIPLAE